MEGENTPDDMFKGIVKEILPYLNTYVDKFTEKYQDIKSDTNFSPIGFLTFSKLVDLRAEEKLENYLLEKINFQNIIPAGSLLQGLRNKKIYSSLSNCLFLGRPYDSYSGIDLKEDQLVQVMKRRCGAGLDLSSIRPDGSIVHNQSKIACGPILFAKRYANTTAEVAQNGRRGALMLSIVAKHPDSLNFALMKQNTSLCTGCNISVIFDDEFMEAVMQNKNYYQVFPVDYSIYDLTEDERNSIIEYDKLYEFDNEVYVRKIDPVNYWTKIIESAHKSAEPGILFSGNWYQWGLDGFYPEFKPYGTNPCSEIPMSEYETCRLLAVNLYAQIQNKFTVNSEVNGDLEELFYLQGIIGDIVVDLECEYIQNIINKIGASKDPEELKISEIKIWDKIMQKSLRGRRIGTGFTGLSDAVAALGCDYKVAEEIDSPALWKYDPITNFVKMKMKSDLSATTDLAFLYGPFDGWDVDKEFLYDPKTGKYFGRNEMTINILKEFPNEAIRMINYGRRNVSFSTCAPNGSLSIEAQTSFGIEPLFYPYSKRRLKILNKADEYDFIDPNDGNRYKEFYDFHPAFRDWFSITFGKDAILTKDNFLEAFEKSPWIGNCSDSLSIANRISVQQRIQHYTTHAISSTINLPADTEISTISTIYEMSYTYGLKGNTIYREGCRAGVVVRADGKLENQIFGDNVAPERPRELDAHYYTVFSNNKVYSIMVGLLQERPYEIFIVSNIDAPTILDLENETKIEGILIREDSNWYNFEAENFLIRDIKDGENDEKLVSLFLSNQLRFGVPLWEIIKTIKKTNLIAGTFNYKLCKILALYIKNNTQDGSKCPSCGSNLSYENGCSMCKNCGYTVC
jgi:ribonucleoside-diphosphate reductase alpha chain